MEQNQLQRWRCFCHTRRRCRERFGITLTFPEYEAMNATLAERHASWLSDRRNMDKRARCYLPTKLADGRLIVAVFCAQSMCIVTLLPPHFLKPMKSDRGITTKRRKERRKKWRYSEDECV